MSGVLALAGAVRRGDRSAREIVDDALARIEREDETYNCFRETWPVEARSAADAVDAAVTAGRDPGPLAGAPIAVKDNIATTDGRTSCGSRMLENYRSPFTATAIERLQAAGAVIIGKTNCDEFAMGSSTEHCVFGPTRNPHDPTRVPGGSSGGSAAAVAAGLCAAAIGSDTGGSIRQPAAFCGVVGLKPTYGRISRWGLVAFGSSLDQVGPLTRDVADAALLLQVMAGGDPRDSTCADTPVPDYLAGLDEAPETLRVGVAPQLAGPGNDDAVAAALDEAIETFRGLGATIVDVDLPLTKHAISTYYVIAPAEASSNLARYDGIRYGHRAQSRPGDELEDLYARSRAEGFGPEVQRRIMLGTYALSSGYYDAYYKRALRVRRLIREELDTALGQCDVILGPVTPTPAFELGAKDDPLAMYLCDLYTVGANIAGIPAIALPAGSAAVGDVTLPVGIQLQGPAMGEAGLLRIARMFEQALRIMTVIGIDLGGTHMHIGVVDDDGVVQANHHADTLASEGRDAVIGRIVDGVDAACARAGIARTDVAAVGIAAPGAIDHPRGVILTAPNLHWTDTPLRDLLAERLGLPVVLENDVNAAVWGEHRLGAGRDARDLLGVWVGTGIGGGLVLGGRIHRGPLHTAGEIGHVVMFPDAPPGDRTLEDHCGRVGLSRAIDAAAPAIDSRALAARIADGDEKAAAAVARVAELLGIAIANVVTQLAIDRVVLGGGVTEALGDPFVAAVTASFRRDVFPAENAACVIRATELRNHAGLVGAAMVARDGM